MINEKKILFMGCVLIVLGILLTVIFKEKMIGPPMIPVGAFLCLMAFLAMNKRS